VSTVGLRVTVVAPELTSTAGMWGDCSGGWQPVGASWVGRLAELGVPYEVSAHVSEPSAGLVIDAEDTGIDGERVIAGPPPAEPEGTLQLLAAHLGAVVVPDLRGVLVLRLDDPGAAVKEHLRGWAHQPVSAEAWDELWRSLDGCGRASVFCCPGYVRDDGTVVDSRTALPTEWAALDDGVRAGHIDLECHGYTHMDPDGAAWVAAPDRRDNADWYREMWPPRLPVEPSVDEQVGTLRAWQRGAGAAGTAVVAPGERWGLNTLAAARACGFGLFNSWGMCFLQRDVPTWTTGIGSPYLDEPDAALIGTGLPQVGYWHDRDMAVQGPRWVGEQLEKWRDSGVRRAMSFAELYRAYQPIDAVLDAGEVGVRSGPPGALRVVRP